MAHVIPLLMVSFIIVAGVGPSSAEPNSAPEVNLPTGVEVFLVNRESTMPPSESHSGRVSSSPEGSQYGNQRNSSRSSGIEERPSSRQVPKNTTEMDKESREHRGSSHDPFKGGGESHSNIKKRSRVR